MTQTKLTPDTLPSVWRRVLSSVGRLLASELNKAGLPDFIHVPGHLYLRFPKEFRHSREHCEEWSRVGCVNKALRKITGETWRLWVTDRHDPNAPTQAANPGVADPDQGLNNCFFKTEKTILHDELRFRAPPEVTVYEELKKRKILFFPNAAAVLGVTGQKREPDFLVCHEGRWGILEVMGATYHNQSTAIKDHDRARLFKDHGLLCIEFFPAQRCEADPAGVVNDFLAILARH